MDSPFLLAKKLILSLRILELYLTNSFCGNDNNEVIMRAFGNMPPRVKRRLTEVLKAKKISYKVETLLSIR